MEIGHDLCTWCPRPPVAWAASEGLSVAEKGWREASPTSQSYWALTRPRHSPLRTPSLGPLSSGGLLAASAASPTLKLPFRVRMTGDLVGPKARRRKHNGDHGRPDTLTRTAGGKLAPHRAVPGVCGDVGLEVIVHIRLLVALQLAHVGGILLARVIQLAALAQHLEVHRQRGCLHVHHLVVGDGGLQTVGCRW